MLETKGKDGPVQNAEAPSLTMTASASNAEVKERALRMMTKTKQNHFSQRNGGPPNSKED